jgi:hypothetical protein
MRFRAKWLILRAKKTRQNKIIDFISVKRDASGKPRAVFRIPL